MGLLVTKLLYLFEQEFYLPRCVVNLPALLRSKHCSIDAIKELVNHPFRHLKAVAIAARDA